MGNVKKGKPIKFKVIKKIIVDSIIYPKFQGWGKGVWKYQSVSWPY